MAFRDFGLTLFVLYCSGLAATYLGPTSVPIPIQELKPGLRGMGGQQRALLLRLMRQAVSSSAKLDVGYVTVRDMRCVCVQLFKCFWYANTSINTLFTYILCIRVIVNACASVALGFPAVTVHERVLVVHSTAGPLKCVLFFLGTLVFKHK